ncbi:MAG: AAA family ATPase [Deltaproteobacteria bacterium]|nr:AAA family ATPase [Deltaproteobacteria bacterium]
MIREVAIRRFKQFEDVTFGLSGHVVLAGQNNSGKTTVLQALSAWSQALELWRLLNDTQKHNGYYSKKPVARQAFSAVPLRSFDLLWRDREYAGSVEIEVTTQAGWKLAMELDADSTEQIYVRPSRLTPREVLQQPAPTMVYVSSMDGLEIEEPAINNPEWIRTLLGRQRPGSILRNLLYEVSRTPHWDDLRGTVRKLFGVELEVPQTYGGQIICEFGRPGKPTPLDIMSGGSGLHQVLLLLACLYTRAGSVLLIDEPDAHLHVFLQDTIFSEIRSVAAKTNSQVVLATHSEVIFRSVPPESLVVMMGRPRRLADCAEREKLARAMGVLEQVDVINALSGPGVMYLEGYTDLNLLRVWADKLGHPAAEFFDVEPFWKPQAWEPRDGAGGIRAKEHFEALELVREDITGVWLIDADGKARGVTATPAPERGKLNRIAWSRYETESYLVHPAALECFLEHKTGEPAQEAVHRFFAERFGAELTDAFYSQPFAPPALVENFLKTTKARTSILGALFEESGLFGLDYTHYEEVALCMTPEEVHPEVREKLDFIQQAFGL